MQESHSRKGKSAREPIGTLARLFRDNAGNTLAIVGAALIPITAMIGSGLDMSRAYMAKSRLQSACDAASLAARRVMKDDELSEQVLATGNRFFDFNFPQGLYQTEEFDPAITRPDTGLVRINAETRIPTTVMRLFGFDTLPLEVSCESSLNFVNTDVVLVLDVTGSMEDRVGGTKKIDALRDAVMALYDELAPVQTQLQSQGLRLRYGVVPYSGTVNVGRLIRDENEEYITDTTPYQSRVANFNQVEHVADPSTTTPGQWEYYNGSSGSGSSSPTNYTRTDKQCRTWVTASPTNSGTKPSPTTVTSYRGSSSNSAYSSSTNRGWSGAPNTGSCRRWKTVTTTTYTTRYKFSSWTYQEASLDTSEFKRSGGQITLATNSNGTVPLSGSYNLQELASAGSGMGTTTESWNGCIEERGTVDTITAASGFSIPADAHDLNINRIPDNDATRWRPMLRQAIFQRQAGSASRTSGSALSTDSAYWACPYEARRLDEWERSDLDDYLDELQSVGGTYHDIGMIWGARLISTGGIFGDGCEEYNGMPCNRHVIFMTDGQQTAYCNLGSTSNPTYVYTAWGVEPNDIRVTGAGNCPSQLARHEQRFKMICNATKNMDVSVWVVAFDTALNADLKSCASNFSQATTSTNADELIESFREIGNKIGALRLTK